MLIICRNMSKDDEAFIYSTWLKGAYYGNEYYSKIDKNSYMRNYSYVIERLLSKPGVKVVVACLEDTPDAILGYSVFEDGILHWSFVKQVWRKQGLAKQMLAGCNFSATTHTTKQGEAIRNKKGWLLNPWLI